MALSIPLRRPLCFAGALTVLFLTGLAPHARAQGSNLNGLWVGTVSLDKVSDPKGGLTESGGTFQFRVLFHVNSAGSVSLLKDVMVIQYDHDNNTATAAKVGLVTDSSKLPSYRLVSRPDGRSSGVRYSASAYDFDGLAQSTVGRLALEQSLEYSLRASENGPTNPFRHKYHPEHAKGRIYTRDVTINFKGGQQADTPGGATRITGTYKEVIRGLVKNDIQLTGSVSLDRLSDVTTLNP